ncbi:hypothetical protein [Noviherbaspirillum galbum]|uniref:Uncharacterized protein n=1 Tax=Noviherbaspirillum galbum TaxID=2709383 RepID=A0A6B3SMK1_9BURK|nr:hypothetical protein [Noviherbaspirillum galbum]NEX59612.1 hypothetical protein [Noviherbaspirillum galbum]
MFKEVALLSALRFQASFVAPAATANAKAGTANTEAQAAKGFFSRVLGLCEAVSAGADKWAH